MVLKIAGAYSAEQSGIKGVKILFDPNIIMYKKYKKEQAGIVFGQFPPVLFCICINNWSGGPILMPAATIRCYTVSSDVPVKTTLPDPAVLPAYSGSDPSVPVPGRIDSRRTPDPPVPIFPVSGHRVPAPALR